MQPPAPPPPPPPPQQRQYHLSHEQQKEQNARQLLVFHQQKQQHQQQQQLQQTANVASRALRTISPSLTNVQMSMLQGNHLRPLQPKLEPKQEIPLPPPRIALPLPHQEVVVPPRRERRSKRPTVIVRAPSSGLGLVKPAPKPKQRSGFLGELNPGIIGYVRTREHINYIIQTFTGSASVKRPCPFPKPSRAAAKKSRDEEQPEPEPSLSLEGMFKKVEDTQDTAATAPAAAAAGAAATSDDAEDEQADDVPSYGAPASQFFQLLEMDIRGRINAVKRSRQRVTSAIVMKDELLYSTAANLGHFCVPASENEDPDKLKQALGLQLCRWKGVFSNMDAALGSEARRLENQHKRVQDLFRKFGSADADCIMQLNLS